jgi:hypothetical protein
MVRLNNAAKHNATPVTASTSKGKAKDEEIGVGGSDGLGRQNTITQRSVGLPTATSTSPANTNMRGKAGTFAPPPSPSSRVSSPTAPVVARQRQVPGMAKIDPSTSARPCICSSMLTICIWLVRSFPRVSLYARHLDRWHLLSRRDPVRSWPSLSLMLTVIRLEADSGESDDSEDDIPLQPAAQPRPPRPGTSRQGRPRQQERT